MRILSRNFSTNPADRGEQRDLQLENLANRIGLQAEVVNLFLERRNFLLRQSHLLFRLDRPLFGGNGGPLLFVQTSF
jgi:hypothetical protein